MPEDVSTLERSVDLTTMELALQRLPALVGSPLSVNSLREDLDIAHKTLSTWPDITVKKEQKHYHFDWTRDARH